MEVSNFYCEVLFSQEASKFGMMGNRPKWNKLYYNLAVNFIAWSASVSLEIDGTWLKLDGGLTIW